MKVQIGKTNGGESVRLTEEQFRRGGYILGLSGTGKSTLEANAFLQVIGDEERRWGGVLLDPAGDLVRDVSRRIPKSRREDVIYVDPLELRDHPLALNPFAPLGDDADVDFLATEIMGVFRLLLEEYWDETLEATLRNVTMMLLASRPQEVLGERWWPALDEVAPLLLLESVDDETKPWHKQLRTTYRETVWYPGLEEGDLAQVYQWFQTFDRLTPNPKARMANAIISKLDRFVSNPVIRNMVCQEGSIDFRHVINEGKILLVNLRQESLGDMSSFLASLIMAKLLAAVYHQTEVETAQRPPFAIFADEFHSYATESFLRLYQQGRKFGSTVFVAHTDRGWLRPWQKSALENAQNTFCFNLSPSDAWEMARIFDATPPQPDPEMQAVYQPVLDRPQGIPSHKVDAWLEVAKLARQAARTAAGLRAWAERGGAALEQSQITWQDILSYLYWIESMASPQDDSDAASIEEPHFFGVCKDVSRGTTVERWATQYVEAHRDEDDITPGIVQKTLALRSKDDAGSLETLRRWMDADRPTALVLDALSRALRVVDELVESHEVYVQEPAGVYSYQHMVPYDLDRYTLQISEKRAPTLYRQVPGRPRPYSDVYHQFANELCHQPDYQARCKLTGLTQKPIEVTIQSEPLGLENEDWQEDLGFFKERARQYGQPVGEVTEQLRKREAMRRKTLEPSQTPGGDGRPAYEAAPE